MGSKNSMLKNQVPKPDRIMSLLFDTDYQYLADAGLEYEEHEQSRFLIFKRFPLPEGVYEVSGAPVKEVDVLYIIPTTYNTEGGDMLWTYPRLFLVGGAVVPSTGGPGANEDSRPLGDVVFCRWSRHWNKIPWKPKVDNVQTIVDRITWAFKYPDAKRP